MSQAKNCSPYKNTFFLLFVVATFISNVGTWLFSVGSGWLMTDLDSSPLMVSLVQTATLIPLCILALPAGAIGDIYNQKKIIIISQSFLILNTLVFAYIVYLDKATVTNLLIFTVLNGMGAAFARPVLAALTPQLVGREQLDTAVNLTGVAYNLSRALGPILGGALITIFAIDMPFWVDAVSFAAVIVVILFWKPKKKDDNLPRRKLRLAMADSIRFLRHTPALYHSIMRAIIFFFTAAALWALLPLIAKEQLGGGADLYGYFLGAAGFGAVAGVALSNLTKDKFTTNRITVLTSCILGVCLIILGITSHKYLVMGTCFFSGICWHMAYASIMTSAHYALPKWYGARGMAYFLMAVSGSMAAGSAIWGFLAEQTSIAISLYVSGGLGVALAFVAVKFPLGLAEAGTSKIATDIPELSLPSDKDNGGWIMVQIVYTIARNKKKEALRKIRNLRNSRYRGGAVKWKLFSSAEKENQVVESFYEVSLDQFEIHQRQITKSDKESFDSLKSWIEKNKGSIERQYYLEA